MPKKGVLSEERKCQRKEFGGRVQAPRLWNSGGGGESSPSGQARGRVAGGDDAVGGEPSAKEHRPGGGRYPCMLQRGLRQRVVTLPLLVLLASDGMGRGRQIGHFVSTPPHRENGSSHTPPHRTEPSMSSLSLSLSRPPPRRLDFLDSTHPWVFAAHDVDALPPPHDAAVLAHLLHRGPDLHRARARLHSDFSRSHCLPQYDPWPPWFRGNFNISNNYFQQL